MESKPLSAMLFPSLLATLLLADGVLPAKVLMVPMPVKSHAMGQAALAVELHRRGHAVHFFYPSGLAVPSELKSAPAITVHMYARQILGLDHPLDFEDVYGNITKMLLEGTGNMHDALRYIIPISASECERIFVHNEQLFSTLKTLGLDIAVVDGLFMFKCLYLVPHRLGVPWITHTDVVESWLVRTPWLPSFVPTPLITLSDRMTFLERLQNAFVVALMSFSGPITGLSDQVLDRYRRDFGNFANLDELITRSVLWLTSRHLMSDYAKPGMPNVIDTGGMTVKPSTKQLPADIAKFVDGAKKGVILVTFGSMASSFPEAMTRKFIAAFDRLQSEGYRVIWRFNNAEMKVEFSPNIWVSDWLPQNDLLAHPRVLLFITHGGNNGQLEAIYHAVPMIGFPLNGDQPYNVRRMAVKGYGLAMDIHDFDADELVRNAREVITNPAYKRRVARASEIFRSDPQSPTEKAAWWVEHVVKYGGAHLRSAGNDLAWYEYWLLDVLGVLCVLAAILLAAVFFVCRAVARRCCCRSRKLSTTSKTKRAKTD